MANLKESLSKIALDVHDDDDEELSMYTSQPRDQSDNGSSGSERRASRNFSSAPTHSPIVNGFDSPSNHEVSRIYLCSISLMSLCICVCVCVGKVLRIYIRISSLGAFLNHPKLLFHAPTRNGFSWIFMLIV